MSAAVREPRARRSDRPAATVRVRPVAERLPATVEAALAAPGEPLGAEVRGEMEQRLGHDFGHVRIHTDARAAAAARALDSLAFTSGPHVVFAEGRYHPHTPEGRRLLAHELVHTLQQRGAAQAVSLQISSRVVGTADPLEAEAAAVADKVVTGQHVPAGGVSLEAPAARGRIARQAREAIARVPREDSLEDIQAAADDVARLLLFDPQDTFGRARRRVAQLMPATREAVASAVRGRVTGPAAARLDAILVELRPPGSGAPPAPEPVDRPASAVEAAAPDVERPSPIEALGRLWRTVVERLRPRRELSPAEDRAPAAAALVGPEPVAARPIEPPSTAPVAAVDAEQPPEQIASHAVADLAAPETAPAMIEPEAPVAPSATAPTSESSPPPRMGGTEETSETGEEVDPRVDEAATAGPEDSEDEVAAAEASATPTAEASPGPGPSGVPERSGAGGPPPSAGPSGAAGPPPAAVPAAPPAAAGLVAGAPEIAPADADPGAGDPPSDEAQQVAAEMTSDAMDEAETEAASTAGTETAGPETAPAGAAAVELEDAEQPAAEAAAEPTIGKVELGPLAEVEPDEDDARAGEGGGGAVAPIVDPPAPEIPAVGGGEPEAGLDTVAALPPTAAAAALGRVRAAAMGTVAAKRSELAAAPPQLERPTGAPSAAEAAAEAPASVAAQRAPAKVERARSRPSLSRPAPAAPPPAPAPAIAAVPDLRVGGSTAGMTDADRAAIRQSIRSLPTTDPALNVTAGAPPALDLRGDADPSQAAEQRVELDKATIAARTDGAADAAAPLGEAAVLPTVAPETLRSAIVTARPPTGAAAPLAGLVGPDPAIDAIIAERRPGELQAAAATARQDMATERQKQAQTTETAGVESRANIEKAVAENAAQQRRERSDLRSDIAEQREQWTAAQKDLVDTSQTDADKAGAKLTTDVVTEREKGTTAADKHISDADKAIVAAREAAERDAELARRRGEEDPTGFLGWVASQATAFFESIKTAIKDAFESARKAVKQAIDTAQKLAAEAIDTARNAVVKAIKAAGDKLIEIGDGVLAGFPRLRTRFRGAIRDVVGAAQRAVNALADGLKVAVQAYLDLYAKALDGILGLLETGLVAAVDAYAVAVHYAIKAAQFVLDGLGDLVEVARDIAAGPAAWLRNLGAAIADGICNHLWAAFKKAVTDWFDAKVDGILGLGKMVWSVLAKGGITFAAVAKFAFAALKKVIPIALIKLLITKLVGMLVPAAAAVMAIIEGLQAAWAAAGTILGAISKFIVFLKAVKGGNAGAHFAAALAAAAVAVIEFVSFWLLRRLLKPAARVGKAIKGVASKIAAMLKRLVQALKRGIRKLTRRAKAWMLKMGRRFKKLKQRFFGKGKKKNKRQRQEDRLKRAVAAIKPPLQSMLRRGTSEFLLRLRLGYWQLRWWLSSLSVGSDGVISAQINPRAPVTPRHLIRMGVQLEQILIDAEQEYFREYERQMAKDPSIGRDLTTARERLAAGDTNLPELSRKEQIVLFRDIRAGRFPNLSAGTRINFGTERHPALAPGATGGFVERVWVRDPGRMAMYWVTLRRGGGEGLPSFPPSTEYPELVNSLERFGAALGLPGETAHATMLGLIRARTRAEFDERAAIAMAGMNPVQAQRFLTEFSPHARGLGLLAHALEPARGPGLAAATSIAGAISSSPAELMAYEGRLALMSQKESTSTIDARRRAAEGIAETRPPTAKQQRERTRLEGDRRARIAHIFAQLRVVTRNGTLAGLAGAEAEVLSHVAEKFKAWTKARIRRNAPEALIAAATELVAAVVAWMKRYYG
jgi:hypothetical protein